MLHALRVRVRCGVRTPRSGKWLRALPTYVANSIPELSRLLAAVVFFYILIFLFVE